MTQLQFPPEFVFGTATASYQIEGAVDEDGRSPSIWDTFSHTPGRVRNGDTGDVACDHYHRLDEDLDLIASYGLDAYRFSIAWPRVQPGGSGERNPRGIDFYHRLVDGLLERGVRPVATLYHWDLPQALQDRGGWAARETAERFAEYATICGEEFGDRVHTFTTFNEPYCFVFAGYATGGHAPGLTDDLLALRAAHHVGVAHGLALQALRASSTGQPRYSLTLNPMTYYPGSDSDADRRAVELADTVNNQVFSGPMLKGAYPELLLEATRDLTDWSFVLPGDLTIAREPIDVLGINWYNPQWVRMRPDGEQAAGPTNFVGARSVELMPQPEGPKTDMGWLIQPEALYDQLTRYAAQFPGLPMMITENGAAFDDPVVGGRCHDERRVDYLRRHLEQCHRALSDGVPLTGYFAWSLMDNFEWAEGYGKRFGLTHVDYETQARTPRDSALFFAELARTRTLQLS